MRRRVNAVVWLAALVGALTVTSAPISAAAEGDGAALVSLDGVVFAESPQGSIFPGGLTLVPGARHTERFWVRNDSVRAAELRISVSDTTARSTAFVEQLTLQARTPDTDDTSPVALEPGATCTALLEGELIPAHAVTEVSITLGMDDSVENAHQGETAGTTLMVSLSEPGAPSSADDCTPGGGIPVMPNPDGPTDAGDGNNTDDRAQSGGSPAGGDGAHADGSSHGNDPKPPATVPDNPVGAAAPPSIGTGSPVLFPWMAVGAVVLAGGLFFGLRQRKGHRE